MLNLDLNPGISLRLYLVFLLHVCALVDWLHFLFFIALELHVFSVAWQMLMHDIPFTPHCFSSFSCINEYLATDSGGYVNE